ncbi:MAG: aminotransferase class I/II-fold pyridoxal phosphate-dependent enzyme [Acidobacteria bacterium]|nr:aminotransferase class I/II-fold pyridoxal phosphate-dependent enzyme [Acidobacteriota bacterium]
MRSVPPRSTVRATTLTRSSPRIRHARPRAPGLFGSRRESSVRIAMRGSLAAKLRYHQQMVVDAPFTVPVAKRSAAFDYAIRGIVAEARKAEARGRRVRYLNIGDPVLFGFRTPPHLIEAVERAMRDGYNGYTPAAGVPEAREAVAADFETRGLAVSPDRVVLTAGASEGIDLALSVLVDHGDEVLVSVPTYPLYTGVLAKLGARAVYYRKDPAYGWQPDIEHVESLISPRTRALVVVDPNNPTGAVYTRDNRLALLELADRHNIVLLSDEGYTDLAYDGRVSPLGSYNPDAPVISFSSLSKAHLAPGWRAGWMAVGGGARLDAALAAIKDMADGRLCSVGPMQYAVPAALNGDKSHQVEFLRALRERAQVTTRRLNAIDGVSCVRPAAAFYAMPKVELPPGRTDEDYVIGLLRATGLLCVYGSGFGTAPADGYFRIVFLAPPAELDSFYDAIETFTADFLAE